MGTSLLDGQWQLSIDRGGSERGLRAAHVPFPALQVFCALGSGCLLLCLELSLPVSEPCGGDSLLHCHGFSNVVSTQPGVTSLQAKLQGQTLPQPRRLKDIPNSRGDRENKAASSVHVCLHIFISSRWGYTIELRINLFLPCSLCIKNILCASPGLGTLPVLQH